MVARGIGVVVVAAALGAVALGYAADSNAPKAPRAAQPDIVISDDGTVLTAEHDHEGRGAFLGVGLTEETEGSEGGARVTSVVPDSPAAKAGLKKGDVIVGFGADVIRGPGKLTQKIHAARPGDKVPMEVMRDGKRTTLEVELGKPKDHVRILMGDANALALAEAMRGQEGAMKTREEALRQAEIQMQKLQRELPKIREESLKSVRVLPHGFAYAYAFGKPKLGVELVGTTPELREHLGAPKDAGVLVGKVIAGSAAEKAGLKVGDVIVSVDGKSVGEASELIELVQAAAGKTVDLDVVRDGKRMKVSAALPSDDEAEDEPSGPRASLEWDELDAVPWGPAEAPEAPEPPEAPVAPEAPEAPPVLRLVAPAPPAAPAAPAPVVSVVSFV